MQIEIEELKVTHENKPYTITATVEITDYDINEAEPDVGIMSKYVNVRDMNVLKYEVLDENEELNVLFSVFQIKKLVFDKAADLFAEEILN